MWGRMPPRVPGASGGGNLSLFPKLDLSWLAVSRSPSSPLFGLTLLRPRIAFGISGVQPGPTEQLQLYQPSVASPPTVGGGVGSPVDRLELLTLGNVRLHPERDQELEGGVDAQFWNQRLTLSLTAYHKLALDDILSLPVAPSVLAPETGGIQNISGQYVNIGNVLNRGAEATLSARILDTRQAAWSINAIISKNTNKLLSLAQNQPSVTLASGSAYSNNAPFGPSYETRLTPGYPLDGLWAPPIISYADVNHDGIINPGEVQVGDSLQYIGAQTPNYEVTVSTTIGLFNNRLSINTSVDYQNGLTAIQTGAGGEQEYLQTIFGSTGTLANEAATAALLQGKPTAIGFMTTVNSLRWQTLSIAYILPPRAAHLFGASGLTLALQSSNLGLLTNYRGKDPNVNAFTSGNLTADNGNALPQPRVWNLDARFTF